MCTAGSPNLLRTSLPSLLFYGFFPPWRNNLQRSTVSSLPKLHDHTQLHTVLPLGLFWTSDQPVAETSTLQHTTLTSDKHPCPRRDSNPQSHQSSGRRPTPLTAPVLWLVGVKRLEYEAGHSPPPSAQVRDVCMYASTPLYTFSCVRNVAREMIRLVTAVVLTELLGKCKLQERKFLGSVQGRAKCNETK